MENKHISNRIIKLENYNDINFSNICQEATVTGAILPSGFQVPIVGTWIVSANYLLNISDNPGSLNQNTKKYESII